MGGWLRRLSSRGGWLRKFSWPFPLITPREVHRGRQWWFRYRHRDGEASNWGLGWLYMVNVDCSPHHAVLVCYLIGIGDPLYKEGALPPWCQLTGTLWRSGHHKDEVFFMVWIDSHRSWRWGHLLVGEGEALSHHVDIGDGILQ